MSEETERVSVDHLTHAAFSGVLRALEERKLQPHQFPGPVLVGIVAWPELSTKAGQIELPEQS